eukprot:GHVU01188480.1.p2 GENE.GHVU01188480.1~~GHVU01188480.1.p2  ORF type:complete len:305 (-),score=60.93 GHVU01188480.1:25-939(-)
MRRRWRESSAQRGTADANVSTIAATTGCLDGSGEVETVNCRDESSRSSSTPVVVATAAVTGPPTSVGSSAESAQPHRDNDTDASAKAACNEGARSDRGNSHGGCSTAAASRRSPRWALRSLFSAAMMACLTAAAFMVVTVPLPVGAEVGIGEVVVDVGGNVKPDVYSARSRLNAIGELRGLLGGRGDGEEEEEEESGTATDGERETTAPSSSGKPISTTGFLCEDNPMIEEFGLKCKTLARDIGSLGCDRKLEDLAAEHGKDLDAIPAAFLSHRVADACPESCGLCTGREEEEEEEANSRLVTE